MNIEFDMKTLRLIMFAVCLSLICPVWAGKISERQAQQVANRFMSSHSIPVAGMRLVHKAPSLNASVSSPYYVFNAGRSDGGYVIVAGDDRVPAVLGYSDNGTFDIDDIPDAMRDWLDGYAAQMAMLEDGGKAATHIGASGQIAPLVTAVWSQGAPYNSMLPDLPTGSDASVGCVATAMAQVMHYWKWPQRPDMSIPSYVTESLNITMPSLPPVDFNWDAMQVTYLTNDTNSPEARAVAELSLYCAQSVEMDFQDDGSSASTSDVPLAMFMYFNYAPTAKYLQRRFYTTQQWESMVLNELAEKRPVIYRGRKLSGGHSFICDGYDGNGMFHFNWGWNGKSNGYFLLNVLNPDLQGTGSASGTYGYILDQGIVVGLQPGQAGDPGLDVAAKYIEIQSSKNTRTAISQDFIVTQMTHFLNIMDDPIDFDYGWALYKDNEIIKVLDVAQRTGLRSGYYIYPSSTLSFGSGISSGTYRIVPIYSEPYAENWRPCIGSDINFIEAIINGNSCSMIAHGAAVQPNYQVNGIYVSGTMHNARPVDVTLDVTNLGETRNDVFYMFANNTFVAAGLADIDRNAQGLVPFRYMPSAAGTVTLKFAFDKDGTNVFATKQIVVTPMPSANLKGSAKALNVTDLTNKIITANEFGVQVTVTNNGTSTYDEDISIKMYKRTYGTTGTLVQALNQRVVLAPQETTTLTFHLDNVVDGWKYFAKLYYYSNGDQVSLASVSTHTVIFPSAPIPGDVNGDGEVSIADINSVIDLILRGEHNDNGDVNGDGEVTIADINAVIDIILNGD